MNRLHILKNRLRYSKQLDRELLSWKYTWLNLSTTDFFSKKDKHFDDLMEAHLKSRMYGTELELSDELKESISNKKNFLKQKFTDMYNYLLRIQQENNMTLNLKDNIKLAEKLTLREKALEYLQYYNEALENIVEGQREVLKDKNFKFADGKTAEQKENELKDFINKYR